MYRRASTVATTHLGRCFTHRAPADIGHNLRSFNGRHHGRHGLVGAEPVAVVVARRHRAAVVEVTEHERHGAEPPHTAPGVACTSQTS